MVVTPKTVAFTVATLLLGVVLGYGGARFMQVVYDPSAETTRQGGYQFINPLLSCDISEDTPDSGYHPLASALNDVIEQAISDGTATRVSVYFRDMNSGRWTGVNEDGLYAPASLMKVPLYLAFLKASQTDSKLLQTAVTISSTDDNVIELIKPQKQLIVGSNYSIDDALHAMIVDSDNNAARALEKVAPNDALADVYGTFGLPVITDQAANSLSPQAYMRLFRILYNATYMGRIRSQAALELMTHTTFTQGLVAGLPMGTPVSHKFGEREIALAAGTPPTVVQLHDCGVVYYPRAPYGICVMTEGTNITELEGVISAVSKTAYAVVDSGTLR